jgi:hypothetical protein
MSISNIETGRVIWSLTINQALGLNSYPRIREVYNERSSLGAAALF